MVNDTSSKEAKKDDKAEGFDLLDFVEKNNLSQIVSDILEKDGKEKEDCEEKKDYKKTENEEGKEKEKIEQERKGEGIPANNESRKDGKSQQTNIKKYLKKRPLSDTDTDEEYIPPKKTKTSVATSVATKTGKKKNNASKKGTKKMVDVVTFDKNSINIVKSFNDKPSGIEKYEMKYVEITNNLFAGIGDINVEAKDENSSSYR